MNDLNSVVVIGRLTRDPELRETRGGDLLAMRIALSRDKKVGDEWVEGSHYFDVVLWGRRATALERYLRKGSRVGIEGHLEWREWVTDSGDKRQQVSIVADNLELLDSRDDGGRRRDDRRNERDRDERPRERARTLDDDLEARAERAEQRHARQGERGGSDVPNDEDELDDIPFKWRPYVERVHTHNPFADAS